MEQRTLGRSGLKVSALGLGCMGMSQSYGIPPGAMRICCMLLIVFVLGCGDSPTDPVVRDQIAFSSNRTGQYDIWLRDENGHLTDLTYAHSSAEFNPAWSPDGQHITFASDRDGFQGEIYVAISDGSNQTRLTNLQSASTSSWSPDGSRIVFNSSNDLWIMNADGSGQKRIVLGGFEPAWSPDGTKIAFLCGPDGNDDICVTNIAGDSITNLTKHPNRDHAPSWSPDGQKLAFYSDRTGRFEIFVMNADGSNQSQRTFDNKSATEPEWSPDGTRIAFLQGVCCQKDIYVMNWDGSNERLVPNTSGASSLSWRP